VTALVYRRCSARDTAAHVALEQQLGGTHCRPRPLRWSSRSNTVGPRCVLLPSGLVNNLNDALAWASNPPVPVQSGCAVGLVAISRRWKSARSGRSLVGPARPQTTADRRHVDQAAPRARHRLTAVAVAAAAAVALGVLALVILIAAIADTVPPPRAPPWACTASGVTWAMWRVPDRGLAADAIDYSAIAVIAALTAASGVRRDRRSGRRGAPCRTTRRLERLRGRRGAQTVVAASASSRTHPARSRASARRPHSAGRSCFSGRSTPRATVIGAPGCAGSPNMRCIIGPSPRRLQPGGSRSSRSCGEQGPRSARVAHGPFNS
jgi:hypothetical protein